MLLLIFSIPHVNDTWYLNPDGLLLENFKGLTNNDFSYEYVPRDPVPTISGNNLTIASAPYDQRSIESRDDVIIFESSTFTEPYEIVGHMWAHLTVKSRLQLIYYTSNTNLNIISFF